MSQWTVEQIAAAINATRRNGRALVEESRILFAAGRYARAGALAILSIEEAGKINVLRCVAVARSAEERENFAKDLTSHREKNSHWIIGALRQNAPFPMLVLSALEGKDGGHSKYLDKLKQATLYTDIIKDGSCREPKDVMNGALAEELINCAEELLPDVVTAPQELELLRNHFSQCENFYDLVEAIGGFLGELKTEGYLTSDPEVLISQLGLTTVRDDKVGES